MSEINNNMHNYGYGKIDRVEAKKEYDTKQQSENSKDADERKFVPDTGVLGRSQIHRIKGADIERSVDEAVDMAKTQPTRLSCSEKIFDTMFEHYLDSGMSEADAYTKALMDEEEFLDISASLKR